MGFGLATALTPTTPTASTATGAAVSGATTAGASASAAGAALVVLPSAVAEALVEAELRTGAAWAGRANAATRPPEAARTAEALTLVSPTLLTIVEISATGLYRAALRCRPERV